jgi:hypothetical protein
VTSSIGCFSLVWPNILLPGGEDDRVDHLAQLVDEVVLEQGLDQAAVSVDQDVSG